MTETELKWFGPKVKAGTPVWLGDRSVGRVLENGDGSMFGGGRLKVELEDEVIPMLRKHPPVSFRVG